MKTPRFSNYDEKTWGRVVFEIGNGHFNSLVEKGKEKILSLDYTDFSEAIILILPVLREKMPEIRKKYLESTNITEVRNIQLLRLKNVEIQLKDQDEIITSFNGIDVVKEINILTPNFIAAVLDNLRTWKIFYAKSDTDGKFPKKFSDLLQKEPSEEKIAV